MKRTLLVLAALLLSSAAQAADPIRIGWLPSLSGPLASAPLVMDLGVKQAIKEANDSGGIAGRKIELVTRDTAGDPTKAVNAAKQVLFQEKADVVIGPLNSGEALAAVPVIAAAKKLNILGGALKELIDLQKYPYAFRMFPSNRQFFEAGCAYAVTQLNAKKIAIVSDTTGYGAFSAKQAEEVLVELGRPPVITVLIDPNKTDVTDELNKIKAAGADMIMPWGASVGMFARLMNGTRDTGWNVPIVGAAALSAAPILKLLNKPEYWNDVYAVGFASSLRSVGTAGMRPETKRLYDQVKQRDGTPDYTFWWYANGYDFANAVIAALRKTGGSTDPEKLKAAMESTSAMPGAFATFGWSPTSHDGFPQNELILMRASTFKDGLFDAAN